jgi:methionyl-tRNA synthetase
MSKFYITTAIVYTNAPPHVGFALELVQGDAIARYHRMTGDEVVFVTGTDEHGTKIQRSAEKAGIPTQEFVDAIAGQVGHLARQLSISNTDFIRTSDRVRHWPAAQKIWQKLAEKGDVYKKSYQGYYCVGHEAFIKESELADGLCPDHQSKPELLQEENWFFRLTTYKDSVKKLIESDRLRIVPVRRKQELLNLLEDAEDVSFSRPSSQLQWGIPVPGDDSQTMYVWADALTNYISALGYGSDEKNMDFWPADVHLIGKDIVRFHAIIWPAMLLAAGLEVPKNLYVHGFITVDGQKMSKSLGNGIDPLELLKMHDAEVVRYFMLRELQSTEDSDFSYQNLESRYNSDLANGLGNLVQRTATLVDTKLGGKVSYKSDLGLTEASLKEVLDDSEYHKAFEAFRLHDAVANVWAKIGIANAYINEREPWKQEGEEQYKTLIVTVAMISHIAWLLKPFMPSTSERVAKRFGLTLTSEISDGAVIAVAAGEPLFPRK